MQNFVTFGTDDFIFAFKLDPAAPEMTDVVFTLYDESGSELETASMTQDPGRVGAMANMNDCYFVATNIKAYYDGYPRQLTYTVRISYTGTDYTVMEGTISVVDKSEDVNIRLKKDDTLMIRVELENLPDELTAAEFTVRGQPDTEDPLILAQGTLENDGVSLESGEGGRYVYTIDMRLALMTDLDIGMQRHYDFKIYSGTECHTAFSGVITVE